MVLHIVTEVCVLRGGRAGGGGGGGGGEEERERRWREEMRGEEGGRK